MTEQTTIEHPATPSPSQTRCQALERLDDIERRLDELHLLVHQLRRSSSHWREDFDQRLTKLGV